MENGLTAAIINPLDDGVRAAFEGASATLGFDEGFGRYLARYGGSEPESAIKPAAVTDAVGAETAREAIRLAGEAIRRAEAALRISAPVTGDPGCACATCGDAPGMPVHAHGADAGPATGAGKPPAQAAGRDAGTGALFQAIVRGLVKAAC